MIPWLKTKTSAPIQTQQAAQKVPAKAADKATPAPDSLDSSKTIQSGKSPEANGSPAPPSAQQTAQKAAADARTLNALLGGSSTKHDDKLEAANELGRTPAVALAKVDRNGTLLEQSVGRLVKTQPKPGANASEAHQLEFEVAGVLLDKYSKLAQTSPAARQVLARVARQAVHAGPLGQSLVSGAVQSQRLGQSAQLQDLVREVARAEDPVGFAEARSRQDLKSIFGNDSDVDKALQIPAVQQYHNESVGEWVLAAEARRSDIQVPSELFGRDAKVAGFVRDRLAERWAMHSETAKQRQAAGRTDVSPTFAHEQSSLVRLNVLAGLFSNPYEAPSAAQVRDTLQSLDEMS